MIYCTYIYKDPKTNVIRYVGKGKEKRPFEHFSARCTTQLGRMLKKRVREGFSPVPIIIPAENNYDAEEMEILLILLIGREDLGQGTLFNKTNGGGGCVNRRVSNEEIEKRKATFKSKTAEEWKDITSRATLNKQKHFNNHEWKEKHSNRVKQQLCKKCTIDGITFFNSRKELIETLGQSRTSGSRSPNFKYVEALTPTVIRQSK